MPLGGKGEISAAVIAGSGCTATLKGQSAAPSVMRHKTGKNGVRMFRFLGGY